MNVEWMKDHLKVERGKIYKFRAWELLKPQINLNGLNYINLCYLKMKLKYFSILDFVVLKYLWLQILPQQHSLQDDIVLDFFDFSSFLFIVYLVNVLMNGLSSATLISRCGWCSHRDFISSFKLSLTYFCQLCPPLTM